MAGRDMAETQTETRASGHRLIALISVLWALIFLALALLLLVPRLSQAGPQSRDAMTLGQSFSLNGAKPEAFALVGGNLVRLDDEGLAVLDASGREQSFLAFPYRESRVFPLGAGLLVTPGQGSGYMAILPDLSTYESDTREIIHGGDLSGSLLLTFGTSLRSRPVASLLDLKTGGYRAILTFAPLEWPLSVSFVPGIDQFDVLLLDLSGGRMETRYLRFDYQGTQLQDTLLAGDPLPLRAHLAADTTFLYNDRSIFFLEADGKTIREAVMPGIPMLADSAAGRLVLLLETEGGRSLYRTDPGQDDLQKLESPDNLSCFALAPGASFLLAASQDQLLRYDLQADTLMDQLSVDEPVRRILALNDRHFLLVFADEAAILTIE